MNVCHCSFVNLCLPLPRYEKLPRPRGVGESAMRGPRTAMQAGQVDPGSRGGRQWATGLRGQALQPSSSAQLVLAHDPVPLIGRQARI